MFTSAGLTSDVDPQRPLIARRICLDYLLKQVYQMTGKTYTLADVGLAESVHDVSRQSAAMELSDNANHPMDGFFGIPPFFIPRG